MQPPCLELKAKIAALKTAKDATRVHLTSKLASKKTATEELSTEMSLKSVKL